MTFEFLKNLSETRVLSNRTSIEKYSFKDISEFTFLYFLCVYILKLESPEYVSKYVEETIKFGYLFDEFKVVENDLYNFMYVLKSGKLDKKVLFDDVGLKQFLNGVRFKRPDREGLMNRYLLELEKDLFITNADLKNFRRKIREWDDLSPADQNHLLKRIIYYFKNHLRFADLLPAMKKLHKDEIEESLEDPSNMEDVWANIEIKCSDVLNYYKKTREFLYRGDDHAYNFFKKSPVNRKPTDSNPMYQAAFDEWAVGKGFITNRSNSHFCSKNRDIVVGYGDTYIIFPINGSKYLSSDIDDFTIWSWLVSKDDPFLEDAIKWNIRSAEFNKKFYKLLDSANFEEKDLPYFNLKNTDSEILVHGDIYLMHYTVWKEFIFAKLGIPTLKTQVKSKMQESQDEIKQQESLTAKEPISYKDVALPTLNVERDELPQIQDVDAFLEYLKDQGIPYTNERIAAKELKATQKEFNPEKIEGNEKKSDKPLIVSMDNYILDGHHRWTKEVVLKPEDAIKVVKVYLSINELFKVAREFDGAKFKAIDESKSPLKLINELETPVLSGMEEFIKFWYDTIKPNCSKILKHYRKNLDASGWKSDWPSPAFGHRSNKAQLNFYYSIRTDFNKEYGIFQSRNDRKPKDTVDWLHHTINNILKELDVKARRDNSVFTSAYFRTLQEYDGKKYIVFPFDDANLSYIIGANDLYLTAKEIYPGQMRDKTLAIEADYASLDSYITTVISIANVEPNHWHYSNETVEKAKAELKKIQTTFYDFINAHVVTNHFPEKEELLINGNMILVNADLAQTVIDLIRKESLEEAIQDISEEERQFIKDIKTNCRKAVDIFNKKERLFVRWLANESAGEQARLKDIPLYFETRTPENRQPKDMPVDFHNEFVQIYKNNGIEARRDNSFFTYLKVVESPKSTNAAYYLVFPTDDSNYSYIRGVADLWGQKQKFYVADSGAQRTSGDKFFKDKKIMERTAHGKIATLNPDSVKGEEILLQGKCYFLSITKMHLLELLKEPIKEAQEHSPQDAISKVMLLKQLKKNCSKALELISKNKFLTRNITYPGLGEAQAAPKIFVSKSPENRPPKDMEPADHKLLVDAYTEAGIAARRDNSFFAYLYDTVSWDIAPSRKQLYVILPEDNADFSFIKNIYDLWSDLGQFTSTFKDQPTTLSPKLIEDTVHGKFKDFNLDSYQNGEEILIHGKCYFIHVSLAKELLAKLNIPKKPVTEVILKSYDAFDRGDNKDYFKKQVQDLDIALNQTKYFDHLFSIGKFDYLLDKRPNRGIGWDRYLIRNKNRGIGYASYSYSHGTQHWIYDVALKGLVQNILRPSWVFLDPEYRGKGLVSPIYRYLLEQGKYIISDSSQSIGSRSIWKKLWKEYHVYYVGNKLEEITDILDHYSEIEGRDRHIKGSHMLLASKERLI